MYNIKNLIERHEWDENRDAAKLKQFGDGAVSYAKQQREIVGRFYNGENIVTKENWGEVESALMTARHLDWIVLKVEDGWSTGPGAATMGTTFTKKWADPVHAEVAEIEKLVAELRKVIFK